jgi:phosphate:Na+ symporter
MLEIILPLLAGLALFLFAVTSLSEVLKDIFSEKAKNIIARFTKNLFTAILTGCVITILMDSSSAVIVMTIVFVNSRILTFRQAMGIVMGANIGTTISSQIIAMDVGKYSSIPLFLGFLLLFVAKTERIKSYGRILLYFGILFFGLFTMERAVEPLRDSADFEKWMTTLENPLKGSLIGGLVTLIIQSSSATVGIAITLAKKGLLEVGGGIAVMLGAELGTCSDTLLATLKTNRQAVKTGVFHLTFNLISIIFGLALFEYFVQLVLFISKGQTVDNQIANAHVLFNVMGVIIFLPFVGLVEKLLNRWIPEKQPVALKETSVL